MAFPFSLDVVSFAIGFVIATIFWWLVGRARPLWKEIQQNLKQQQEETQVHRTSGVEENHRRMILRHAQGMHLAASLFTLDEILQEPKVLAPPPHIEPDGPIPTENVVTETLPYLPAWPELAAIYMAPTLSLPQALSGGKNLVIIGQPGTGKTVALAHLASLAANRSETLGELAQFVPFLLHVADLKLPVTEAKECLNPIIELSSEDVSVLDMGRLTSFIQTTFQSGRALLLLDGFDELTPEGQKGISDYLLLLLQTYPKIRVVTTGAPEYNDGLIDLGFAPLAMAAWNKIEVNRFIENWGKLWTEFVAVEAWAQTGPEQVDPLLLNAWLKNDNQGMTALELTLKVWGGYAGDSLGPHVLEAIASHIRRLAPANTPLAALEMLAMQVILTAQPFFDPRKAKDWVKSFEAPEEIDIEAQHPEAAAEGDETQEEESKKKKKKDKKNAKGATPSPTPGLLGKMASSGLVIAHRNNRMRFIHPIIAGFLAGRALSGFKAEDVLLDQPDWIGKVLAMRYLAAHGDVSGLAQKMLEWSRMPMHRPLLTTARWLRDAPRQAAWRGKVLARLAELMKTEGLPMALRGQALAAFVVSNDPSATTLFRQFMNTLSFDLVRLAALGSGALQDVKSIKILENTLSAPSLSARRAACLALVGIGTNDALEVVARTLLNADEDLRRAAAESLANDPHEGYAMLRDGATLKDILVRRAVVYGLAKIDEPWCFDIIKKMQVEDDQWVVRNSASEVLEFRSRPDDPRIPRPLKTPSQAAWLIAFASSQGVGIAPGAPATDLLVAALKSPKGDEQLAALPYLKYNRTEGIIKNIYEAMYADNPELREAAFLTLWEIGASGYKLPDPTRFGFS